MNVQNRLYSMLIKLKNNPNADLEIHDIIYLLKVKSQGKYQTLTFSVNDESKTAEARLIEYGDIKNGSELMVSQHLRLMAEDKEDFDISALKFIGYWFFKIRE
jgi:hypothetical protein